MNKTVIEVQVRAVLPTSGGCAVFIGNSDKVFIIYVDQTVGSAITMFMRDISKERPLTHDLMAHLMTRSEEHTSELQSPCNLVCRLLLEKKKISHCNTTR